MAENYEKSQKCPFINGVTIKSPNFEVLDNVIYPNATFYRKNIYIRSLSPNKIYQKTNTRCGSLKYYLYSLFHINFHKFHLSSDASATVDRSATNVFYFC